MCNVELSVEHCPTGARPHNYDSSLMASTKCSRRVKKHEVKTHNRFRELQYSEKAFHWSPCPCSLPHVTRSRTFSPSTATLIFYIHSKAGIWRIVSFLRPSNEQLYFMLYCFSLQYFIKYIIPSHAHFKAQKLICPSEIHLAGIHGALLGSRTYIIHREVFQLLSYAFTTGTDATGMMSGKCWVGLALCSSATPASAFHQEGGNKPPIILKLSNSSPRFYFKAQAKRAGYFFWCY